MERCIELIFKLNLHKRKSQKLDRNFNWLHILLAFVYGNVPLKIRLTEEEVYQYLEHLFKEKFDGSWKPLEKK